MPPFIAPIRLRSLAHESARKVTWLELFFDLMFVAAIAQVAAPLRDDYSVAGLVRFAPLLLLIWLAWTGHTAYATRFDTDDIIQRGLTLVQMFTVAVMAANARDALDSRSSAGFVAAYGVVRLLLVAQYARARHVPGAGPLATRYALGHGVAALIWLASAVIPAPERFIAWGVAFVIDLGTPWAVVPHSVTAPPDAAHLPERFGLFTLILLGESVAAVMHGMESQENWPVEAALSAFLGMASLFLIWWWYFDGADAVSEQHVRSDREALRFHIWTYAHFPLCLGIVIVGVGIQRIVTTASHSLLMSGEAGLATAGAAVVMLSMSAIAATSRRKAEQRAQSWLMPVALAGLVLMAGARTPTASPLVLAVALAATLLLQLALALSSARLRIRTLNPEP
jgi:low temperature requirement protein LtrA